MVEEREEMKQGEMAIHRYPNMGGMMRGPNMATNVCNKCYENRTHGYWIFEQSIMDQAVFICDDCLNDAKKEK